MAGRVDLVIKWKATGDLFCLDYKTASEVSARYFANFKNCPQTVLYTIATEALVGEKCKGMIIEALRSSKVRSETQMNFNYVLDHQKDSFIRMATMASHQIAMFNEKKTWPKHCTGCGSYSMFGSPGRVCPYAFMCNQPDWQRGVHTYKREEPFHPITLPKSYPILDV